MQKQNMSISFKICKNCPSKTNCCSRTNQNSDMGSPIVIEEDIKRIKEYILKNNISNINFYKNIDYNTVLKTDNQGCIFYQDNKCNIYEVRPLDCKLFPFDILSVNSKISLVYYTDTSSMCHFTGKLSDEIEEYILKILKILNSYSFKAIKEYISKTQPWAQKYKTNIVCELLYNEKSNDFEIKKNHEKL